MATTSRPTGSAGRAATDPGADRAYHLLHVGFTVAPIAFGADKFANLLVDWPTYLAPVFVDLLPGSAQQLMYVVGVIEIVAGVVVWSTPRFGGLLVATWLAGVIVNLLIAGDYYDIALRDFGLLVGALALWQLAAAHRRTRS